MEAVTNAVFRGVVEQAGAPDLFYTEFTHAKSITHPKAKFAAQGRLYVPDSEPKFPVIQLWGNDGKDYETASVAVREMGYEAININMGCPAPTVIKNHGGSDMIRHPDDAAAVIAGAKKAGLPVSVKTRLGYSDLDEFREWIPFLLRQDVQTLMVHVRTRKEMSKVPAHYEVIDELIQMRDAIAPDTLIGINGDVENRTEAVQLALDHPGLDGVMIGRGIFHNPFCFETEPKSHTIGELVELLRLQLANFDKFSKRYDNPRFAYLKRFFKIYIKDFAGSNEARTELMDTTSTDDVRRVLDENPHIQAAVQSGELMKS
ncbi:tRNA-dihydrouridine synthase [Levilactobacillus bambusae]|uniref:tRNA-dihydrouridine synthase n=2 Tax=Levilactobacillus bambusae TaxID=2024736 RepID=A0A2V1N0Q3_9LACO|nr:tRNA-dihydrouridine synthase [Levilactobacillus bambusae]